VPEGGMAGGWRFEVAVVPETEPACTRVRSWRGMSLFVVGEQIGEDGKTPE
jgi:hypothetical protein